MKCFCCDKSTTMGVNDIDSTVYACHGCTFKLASLCQRDKTPVTKRLSPPEPAPLQSMLVNSLSDFVTVKENLFIEYARDTKRSILDVARNTKEVVVQGQPLAKYYYKDALYLIMADPQMESTPTGLVITFRYQKLWEKPNETSRS